MLFDRGAYKLPLLLPFAGWSLRMSAPTRWTRHRIGSNEYFDRGRTRLRYCNMRCWPMSASGQKRTWRLYSAMSALPPKADILLI